MSSISIHPQTQVSELLESADLERSLLPVIRAIEQCLESGLEPHQILTWWAKKRDSKGFSCDGKEYLDILCRLDSTFSKAVPWYEMEQRKLAAEIERLESLIHNFEKLKGEKGKGKPVEPMLYSHIEIQSGTAEAKLARFRRIDDLRKFGAFSSAYPFVDVLNHVYENGINPAIVINEWVEDFYDSDISDSDACVLFKLKSYSPEIRDLLLEWLVADLVGGLSLVEREVVQFVSANYLRDLEQEENWPEFSKWIQVATRLPKVSQPVYVLFLDAITDLAEVFNYNFDSQVHELHELILFIALAPRFAYDPEQRAAYVETSSQMILEKASQCELEKSVSDAVAAFVNDKCDAQAFFPPQYLTSIFNPLLDQSSVFCPHVLSIPNYCNERLDGKSFSPPIGFPGIQVFYEIAYIRDPHIGWNGHLPTELLPITHEFDHDSDFPWELDRHEIYPYVVTRCHEEREFELANAILAFFVISESLMNQGRLGDPELWQRLVALVDKLDGKAGFEMTILALGFARLVAEANGERIWARRIRNSLPERIPEIPGQKNLVHSNIAAFRFRSPSLTVIDTIASEMEDVLGADRVKKLSLAGKKLLSEALSQLHDYKKENLPRVITREGGAIVTQFRRFFEAELKAHIGPLVSKNWSDLEVLKLREKNHSRLTSGAYLRIILMRDSVQCIDEGLRNIIRPDCELVWEEVRTWINERGNSAAHAGEIRLDHAMTFAVDLLGEGKLVHKFIDSFV